MSTKPQKSMTDQIMDWFECNPAAKMRSGPLAKALKADATKTAEALGRLVGNGQLDRLRVIVPANERGRAAAEQWEYWLPIGGKAIAPPPAYVPPKSFRRETTAAPTEPALPQQNEFEATINRLYTTAAEREKKIAELENTVARDNELIKTLEAGHDKILAGCDEIKVDMAQKLADSDARIVELEAALAESRAEADHWAKKLADSDARVVELETALAAANSWGYGDLAGYVVATPNKPLRRAKLEKNALQLALSAARANGTAEVYAIFPAGKAVRGAEWRPKSWSR